MKDAPNHAPRLLMTTSDILRMLAVSEWTTEALAAGEQYDGLTRTQRRTLISELLAKLQALKLVQAVRQGSVVRWSLTTAAQLSTTFKAKSSDFDKRNDVDRGRFGETHLTRPLAVAGFRAVFIPSDQTIRYLTDSGEFTLNHAHARIFTDAEAAEQIARDVDGYTELIGDLAEFRLREDTW